MLEELCEVVHPVGEDLSECSNLCVELQSEEFPEVAVVLLPLEGWYEGHQDRLGM